MKKYIKEVKRELSVPRRAKKEIVRDLEEAFASALEHGESADPGNGAFGLSQGLCGEH